MDWNVLVAYGGVAIAAIGLVFFAVGMFKDAKPGWEARVGPIIATCGTYLAVFFGFVW